MTSLAGIVDDCIPVLFRDSNALPMSQVWQLELPDQKELLIFNGDKIDLIKHVEGEISHDGVTMFADHCKAVFGKISSTVPSNSITSSLDIVFSFI